METRIVFLIASVMLLFASSSSAAGGDWLKFNQGLTLAEEQDKVVLVDFYTTWCHWCKVMDEKTFRNEKIADLLQRRFVTVRVNAEDTNEKVSFKGQAYSNVELTRAFNVTGFPSLAFLDSKGEPITVIPGYVPPEEFIHILNYIDKGCYKQQMPFDEFKKKLDCSKP
jgi:thioredoxin-related protein